jgi:biotin-dependent carboxylase-like uncharacterized protein
MLTTVQDLGRNGFGKFGVPLSGALDGFSLRVANLLVDNDENEAALEITLPGFSARVCCDLTAAVTGGDLGLQRNGQPMAAWRSHRLQAGDVLSFSELRTGCRAYLALGGGVYVPPVLGSRSTNLSSGFGGYKGRSMQAGDLLQAVDPSVHLHASGRNFDINSTPLQDGCRDLRVVLGPQDHHFGEAAIDGFLNQWYEVSPQSDRTGIRLRGPALAVGADRDESIVSEGLVTGAVQVPGDGQPIILLRETVSGGYRKIAVVISADLPLLGQLLPGDRIRFQSVSIREARRALWRREQAIARFRDSLV